jgi:2-polyprenyl-3-methyl-5-hydroxy-6-metoxy-1,4-benzoquinol methylase
MSPPARPCPLCAGLQAEVVAALPAERFCSVNSTYRVDFATILGIRPETTYSLLRCRGCGFVFAGTVPSDDFLRLVYDEVIDPQQGFVESNAPGWVAHQLHLGHLVLAELCRQFPARDGFRLLDFGCGYGALLAALNGPRVACVGFESSRRRLDYLHSRHLPALGTLDEVRDQAPFDAIILSDVLEHVPEPRTLLDLCADLLCPGGVLCVNVPDFEDRRLRREVRAACSGEPFTRELNPWEHLQYFSPRTLRALLSAAGFVPLEGSLPVDVGVRPGLRGLARLGNALKSGLRLARHALGLPARRTTLLLARKEESLA